MVNRYTYRGSNSTICLFSMGVNLEMMDGLHAILRPFSVQYFSHIRTIRVDNERLCAMEPRLRLRRFRLERGSTTLKEMICSSGNEFSSFKRMPHVKERHHPMKQFMHTLFSEKRFGAFIRTGAL